MRTLLDGIVERWRAVVRYTRNTAGSTTTSTRSSGASEIRATSRKTESRPNGRYGTPSQYTSIPCGPRAPYNTTSGAPYAPPRAT